MVWDCAKFTTLTQLNRKLENVKRLNVNACENLNMCPKEPWIMAHFKENSKDDRITKSQL